MSPVAEKAEELTAPKEKKPVEPSSHPVENLTRITPSQLPYISFPSNSRYALVRPASASIVTPKKGKKPAANHDYARKPSIAVGGVVVLVDNGEVDAEGQYVELKESLWTAPAPPAAAAAAAAQPASDVAMVSDNDHFEEAEPPAPFEVRIVSPSFTTLTLALLQYPFGED